MKIVLQRVSKAQVSVDGDILGKIDAGILTYVGIHHTDTREEVLYLAKRITELRVFEDEGSKMNLSLQDIEGSVLAISQFTLYGDTAKGRRPSFIEAAPPDRAKELYDLYVSELKNLLGSGRVAEGRFAAHMHVESTNDGPVTLILDRGRSL